MTESMFSFLPEFWKPVPSNRHLTTSSNNHLLQSSPSYLWIE